jgi:hypothetical protein
MCKHKKLHMHSTNMVIVGMQHSSQLVYVHNRDEDMFVGATFFVTIKHLEKFSKCIWRAPYIYEFPSYKRGEILCLLTI